MNSQIPKVIHYCWFGGNEKTELIQYCINSWRKYCPAYEIREWNEHNYDVTKQKYMREAYAAGKWAFVSDYARLDIIYRFGGIYLDTDVELIRSLDALLHYRAVMGFENGKHVATGLICAAVAKHETIKELRDSYDGITFLQQNGRYNMTPCPQYTTDYFLRYGLKQDDHIQHCRDVTIFPTEYFNPKDFVTETLCITENTIAIHHAAMTWHDEKSMNSIAKERMIYKKYGIHGWRLYHGVKILIEKGPEEVLKRMREMKER